MRERAAEPGLFGMRLDRCPAALRRALGTQLGEAMSSLKSRLKMHAMDLTARINAMRGMPFSVVTVETSTHCHRRCSYCPVSVAPKQVGFMRDEVFDAIVLQLKAARFRGRFTYHHYNEPLLNPRLERLVQAAKAVLPDASHVIYTSGDQLTTARYDSLVAAGVDAFIVTDHGGRQLTAPVERATGLFAKLRQTRIRFRRFSATTSLFDRGGLVAVANPRRHHFCAYPAYELVIGVDGDVILCCNDFFGEYKFGNVLEDSLVNIWNSPRMTHIRERLRRGQFDLGICRACVGLPVEDTTKLVPLTVNPRSGHS